MPHLRRASPHPYGASKRERGWPHSASAGASRFPRWAATEHAALTSTLVADARSAAAGFLAKITSQWARSTGHRKALISGLGSDCGACGCAALVKCAAGQSGAEPRQEHGDISVMHIRRGMRGARSIAWAERTETGLRGTISRTAATWQCGTKVRTSEAARSGDSGGVIMVTSQSCCGNESP